MDFVDSYVRPWLLRQWETYLLPYAMALMAHGARKGIGLVLALAAGMLSTSFLYRAFFWLVDLVKECWEALLSFGAWVLVQINFYWRVLLKITWWLLYLALSAWLGYTYAYEYLADAETQDKVFPFISRWLLLPNVTSTAAGH
jgi:hypothetical protein